MNGNRTQGHEILGFSSTLQRSCVCVTVSPTYNMTNVILLYCVPPNNVFKGRGQKQNARELQIFGTRLNNGDDNYGKFVRECNISSTRQQTLRVTREYRSFFQQVRSSLQVITKQLNALNLLGDHSQQNPIMTKFLKGS